MDKVAFDIGVADGITKTALVDQALGYFVGKDYGRDQADRGEKHTFRVPQAAAVMFLPGGAGYQLGRYQAHQESSGKKTKKKK